MNQIETDIDTAKKLLSARMLIKQLSQLSFEAREIDKAFPSDYYEFNNAEQMLELYRSLLDKIVVLSKEINKQQLT